MSSTSRLAATLLVQAPSPQLGAIASDTALACTRACRSSAVPDVSASGCQGGVASLSAAALGHLLAAVERAAARSREQVAPPRREAPTYGGGACSSRGVAARESAASSLCAQCGGHRRSGDEAATSGSRRLADGWERLMGGVRQLGAFGIGTTRVRPRVPLSAALATGEGIASTSGATSSHCSNCDSLGLGLALGSPLRHEAGQYSTWTRNSADGSSSGGGGVASSLSRGGGGSSSSSSTCSSRPSTAAARLGSDGPLAHTLSRIRSSCRAPSALAASFSSGAAVRTLEAVAPEPSAPRVRRRSAASTVMVPATAANPDGSAAAFSAPALARAARVGASVPLAGPAAAAASPPSRPRSRRTSRAPATATSGSEAEADTIPSPSTSATSSAAPAGRRASASRARAAATPGPSSPEEAAVKPSSPPKHGSGTAHHAAAAAAAAQPEPAAAVSAGITAASPLAAASGRQAAQAPVEAGCYVEFHDPDAVHVGSALYAGSVEEWHQQHLRELRAAPVNAPDAPLPTLEQFSRQLDLEGQCRNLALESYRQEYNAQVAHLQVEDSLPAARLLEMWIPQLTTRIEQRIEQFLALRALEERPPARGPATTANLASRAAKAKARTLGARPLSQAISASSRPQPQVAAVGGGGSDSSTGGGEGAAGSSKESAPDVPTLKELMKWVPMVLAVPPPLLAKAVVSGMLNSLVMHDFQEHADMPPGMSLSIDVVDLIGRRVVDMVSYMKACEVVCEKRRELRRARQSLRQGQLELDTPGGLGLGDGKGPAAGQAAASVAGEAAAPGNSSAKGGVGEAQAETLGAKGDDDDDGDDAGVSEPRGPFTFNHRLAQATTHVREARKALLRLEVAAKKLQPSSAAKQVVADGLSASARREAAREGNQLRLGFNNRNRLIKMLGLAERVEEWDQVMRIQVGASLLSVSLNSLRITNADTGCEEAAFTHSTKSAMMFERGGYQTPGMVVAHPQVLRLLEGDEELRRMLQPRFMPMLVEPRPWADVRIGGFLTQTVPIMKSRYSAAILSRLKDAHNAGSMQSLYDRLTVLGNVPWRVNSRVLAVMEEVVKEGGDRLGFPPNTKRPLPPRFTTDMNDHHRAVLGKSTPAQCGTPYLRLQREGLRSGQLLTSGGAMSVGEEEVYQRQCDEVRLKNRNESGERTSFMSRMEIAKQYEGSDDTYGIGKPLGGSLPPLALRGSGSQEPVVFFQPHNVDFRGRAYPLHPHLSHLGDDGARGLLQFGVGRPLGDRGFQWLLMQVANMWGRGIDKYPFAERLAWAEKMLPAVQASAASPLEGSGTWWQGGERPWQLLATCYEVAGALSCGSNPAAYVSYHPVNQDGTCNGLQHYAALARDKGCGAAVNLLPASRPQDVYQAVADAVAERVARARAQGRSEAAKVFGSVDRKLVKQTVMTYVYGVTIVGAREQIENRLEERGWTNVRERRKVATYLAHITFESMGDVFGPAVAVRSWLDNCAKHAVSSGHPVMWRSPLGFPIEQPYRKLPTIQVVTSLQSFTLRDNGSEEGAPLDTRRQRSGFPPNYIHSLDGAHMMMTAAAVRAAGGCFAAVHDSFWTHAASVDDMNTAIRDTFIELHTRPLLHELRSELAANPLYQNATVTLAPVPPAGDLDLQEVRNSAYFFS